MGQYEKDKKELIEKIEQLEHKLKKAKQAGDKPDVDKYSCLTDGFVPNGNANLGRPPRQPGHRPHRKHGQAMGGMNLEDFLAGGVDGARDLFNRFDVGDSDLGLQQGRGEIGAGLRILRSSTWGSSSSSPLARILCPPSWCRGKRARSGDSLLVGV